MRTTITFFLFILTMNTLVHSATLKCVNDKGSIAFTNTQCPPGYKLKSTIVEKPNYVPPAEQSTGHYTRQTSKEYSSSSDCYDTEMGKLKLHDGDPLASLAAMNAGFRTIKAKCSAMFPSDKKKKKAKASNKKCFSDYNCEMYSKCYKEPLQPEGVCIKTVITDKSGITQHQMPPINIHPDSDSLRPNTDFDGQCSYNTDCPISYSCDQKLRICVK